MSRPAHDPLNALEPDVRRAVDDVLALGASAAAAFDADGTLWSGDVGEDFLRELVREERLHLKPSRDPYARYEELLAVDGARAFAWCVEVMQGLHGEALEAWSAEMFDRLFTPRLFPGVRAVLEAFRGAGVGIWLVSASNAFTVRACARRLALDPAKVLAVEGRLDGSGRLTGEVLPPVTCAHGKVEALTAALGGRPPEIAFGNSLFDQQMLEFARRAVVVAPRGVENPAVDLATRNRWPIHRVD